MNTDHRSESVYDTSIKLLLLLLIVVWCLMILYPFASVMLWGFILAVAFKPMHDSITKITRGKSKLASVIIVLLSLAIIIVPSWILLDSVIDEVRVFKDEFMAGKLTIPPPPSERVKSWPIVGNEVYNFWHSASVDLEGTVKRYKEPLTEVGGKIAKGILGAAGGVLQMVISLVIAGVLLVTTSAGESIRKFFRKIAGTQGDEFTDITIKTIGNVVKGVIGVAVILAFLIGGGFALAGVPYAGILTIVIFVFAVLQLPTIIVILPVVMYMYAHMEMSTAIFWSIYLVIAGLSDNVIRPLLLGKGAPVPMLVIFIGVAGGFIMMGFIGLFTGAIVMSLGYTLFSAWINEGNSDSESEKTAEKS